MRAKRKIEIEKNFLIVLKKILLRFTQALVDKKQCLVQKKTLCFQIRFMIVEGSRRLESVAVFGGVDRSFRVFVEN